MAYQGFGRGINKLLIQQLEDIATQGIKPDLNFLLNISVGESKKRRKNMIEDRIESEGEIFLQRVSNGFQTIAKQENWVVIPANKEKYIVSKSIETSILNSLGMLLNK